MIVKNLFFHKNVAKYEPFFGANINSPFLRVFIASVFVYKALIFFQDPLYLLGALEE